MKRLLPLLALLPALAFGHDDDPPAYPAGHNPNHELTADLSVVTGLESPVQGWPPVRLISRGVGGGSLILDQGYGRPRTLAVTGSTVTVPNLMASEAYTREQEYVLVVGSTPYVFVMPNAPTSFAATRVVAGATGPVTVSLASAPQAPSPGDLWYGQDVGEGITPVALRVRSGGQWQLVGSGGGGGPGPGNDIIVASTFQYSEDTSSLVWENPEGAPDSAGIYEGICADVLGTGAAGKVLHWKETGQGRKPICEWEADDTASGGSGLDAAGVRDQVSSQIRGGDNISLTPAGSGASQTLTIAGPDPYNDELLQTRVRSLETFEGALRRTRSIGSQLSLYAATSNAAVQVPGVALPTAPLDQRLLFSIESSNPDDRVVSLATLRGKNAVNTAGTQLDDANSLALPALGGIVYRVAHDGDRLWIAPDTIIQQQDAVTVDVSIDEPNFEPAAYATGTGSQFPPSRVATGTAAQGTVPTADGSGGAAWTLPTPQRTAAQVKTAYESNDDTNAFDDDEQTKLSRYPADCPDGEVVKGAGTGQPFTCETDATATGGEAQNAAIDARIKPPARLGNTTRFGRADLPSDVAYGPHFQLTPQEDASLSIFTGTVGWEASGLIQVSMDQQTTKPTASDAQGKVYVTEQVVGPRQTNAWIVVRVPPAAYPVVDADRARLRLWESSRTVGAPEADAWELLVQTASYRWYTSQFADIPSGATYRAEEHDDVDLIPNRIDVGQWRRTIVGGLGVHFAQQSPGVSPSTTTTSQLVASATALSPTFDLDDADKQHGEFHVSLELVMTQAHSTVSFTQNQPSPGDEDRQRTLSTIVFASDLREEPAFATSNLEGLVLFEVPVWAANTRQGRYWLLLVHDGNNEVALYRHWTGEAGSSPMTITAEARVSFTATDLPTLTGLGGITESEAEALILAPARAGNTTAWSETKAPGRGADLSFSRDATTVTIRSDSGTNTQIPTAGGGNLAGVMSDAQADRLALYPNGCPSGQRLSGGGSGAAFSCAADQIGTGGGGGAPTIIETDLGSDMTLATTDFGTWTAWTDVITLTALTSDQAGPLQLSAHMVGRVTTTPSGGGDRVYMDAEIARVRGAVTTRVALLKTYIRNTGNAPNNPAKDPGTNAVSQEFGAEATKLTNGQAGDVYKLRFRILSQVTTRSVQVDSGAGNTALDFMHW